MRNVLFNIDSMCVQLQISMLCNSESIYIQIYPARFYCVLLDLIYNNSRYLSQIRLLGVKVSAFTYVKVYNCSDEYADAEWNILFIVY